MTRMLARELLTQQRLFWRSYEAAFFTFALPIIFLLLLGSVYGDEEIDGVRGSTYLLAGLLGYGVVATAFAGLAITVVVRRESGVLKRVRGTPLPTSVYLAALIASTLVVDRARGARADPGRPLRDRRRLAGLARVARLRPPARRGRLRGARPRRHRASSEAPRARPPSSTRSTCR